MDERNRIFSRDVIYYKDVAFLRGISNGKASSLINSIKRYFGKEARPAPRGYIDVRDYMDYFSYSWEDMKRGETA